MSNNFSEYIDNYETLRQYLNRYSIYSCFKDGLGDTNDVVDSKETNKRKIVSKLKQALKDDLIKAGGGRYRIENDRYHDDLLLLKSTYRIRKYYDYEIIVRFLVIFTLDANKAMARADLLKSVNNTYNYGRGSQDNQEQRKKVINAMVNDGILIEEEGLLRLCDDIFNGMDERDLRSFGIAAEFFAMKSPVTVPGLFLKDTIDLYLDLRFEADLVISPIIYQHYFPHHITNDNQSALILDGILGKRKIIISSRDMESQEVTPIKLINDCQSGEQLLIYQTGEGRSCISVDDIHVNACDKPADEPVRSSGNNKPKYTTVRFTGSEHMRIFYKSSKKGRNALRIIYDRDRYKCLRFAGEIKIYDESAAADHVRELSKMLDYNKRGKFDDPVKFYFTNGIDSGSTKASDRVFEMKSKCGIIDDLYRDNVRYDDDLYIAIENNCELVDRSIEEDDYFTLTKLPICTTAAERRFVSMMLSDEQCCSLLTPHCRELLLGRLPVSDKWRNKNVYEAEHIGLPHNASHENMQFILEALREKREISYTNTTRREIIKGTAYPYKLLYSQRRNKFQLIAWAKRDAESEGALVLLDVHSMSDLEYADEGTLKADDEMVLKAIDDRRRTVRLLVNGKNELKFREAYRMMSHYRRESTYDRKAGTYDMKITYYDFDKEELVKDILSLGSNVIVCRSADPQNGGDIYDMVMAAIERGIEMNTTDSSVQEHS